MRHIAYIEQFFTLPNESGITRHYDFARALVQAGNRVTVITSYNGQEAKKMAIEGIEVQYIPVAYQNAFGFVKRFWAYTKFALHAIFVAQKLDNVDFAYISSPPLTTGIVALYLKKIAKIPYLFEVRDLWPQFPIEAGGIKNGFIKWAAYRFEETIYRNSERIIACSPGILAGIKSKNVSFLPENLAMISNFSDTELFFRREINLLERNKYLAAEEKGIVYFGAIGKANQVDYFVELAEISEKEGLNLRFFVLGWGSEKERLEKKAEKLSNIHFLAPLPKAEMPFFLSFMDFSYTCFQDLPVLRSNSPNKLFDALAMSLVSFVNMNGWMQEIVEINECGAYIPPTQPSIFIEKIQTYLINEDLLSLHQQHARQIAEKQFSKKVQVQKMLDFVAKFPLK